MVTYEVIPPVAGRSTTNERETSQGNEHVYDLLDRGQTGHKTTPLLLRKQYKSSIEGNRGSMEKSAYGTLEQEKGDKNNSEEHIYHVLEGPND